VTIYFQIHTQWLEMEKFNLLLLACLLCFANNSLAETATANVLPEIVSNQWNVVEKVGDTRFKKLGPHIYDASFWSLKDSKLPGDSTSAAVLSIVYARNIKAQLLLSSTDKEWQRLGFAQQHPLDAWLESLEKMWPDINKGDFLVFVNNDDGSSTFYSDTEILGSINDPAFGSAFLDIWLSKNARYQKYRKELLGEKN